MGSLSELLAVLRGQGMEDDAERVAEALWLSRHISARTPEDRPTYVPPPPIALESAASVTAPADIVGLVPRENPATAPGRIGAWSYRPEVEVPAPPPLQSELRLLDELRALAHRLPDPGEREFDEDATVERSAAAGIPWVMTRAKPIRRREAALVFDRHSSMAAWSGLADEVLRLVERVGFRRVTVHYLDEDSEGRWSLATDARGPARQPISVLRDPTGCRVTMVFSACLGDAWAWGTAAAELERLAESAPVAIVQPLPSQLWNRTGLTWERGRITVMVQNRPSPLRVAPGTPGALAIPVLELAPGWFRPWARLLTGDLLSAGYPLLRPVREPDRRVTLAERQREELGERPLERVRRFRSASSPDAFRLAASLAQVPLRLPIMRLVQKSVLPESKPSVLAEVLTGGLIQQATTESAPPYTIPEDSREFVFRADVAAVLRNALPRSDARGVLDAVSSFITQQYDVPGKVFRATISEPSNGGTPFAYLSPETLHRIAPNFPERPQSPGSDDERRYAEAVQNATRALSLGDPEFALSACLHALVTVPVGDSRRIALLHNVTRLLQERWERIGDVRDLDEAIALAKSALDELPEDESGDFVARLGGLLYQRYLVAGGVDFLIDATRVLRVAVPAFVPGSSAGMLVTEQLGDVLVVRCEVSGEPLFAWDAIESYRAVVEFADTSRLPVLWLKLSRARLDIVLVSAYVDDAVVEELIEQFRYATAGLGPSNDMDDELRTAMREFVGRVRDGADGALLPVGSAARLASILLAAHPGVSVESESSATVWGEARGLLELARTDPPRSDPAHG